MLERAEEEGRLGTLAVEHALGGMGEHTLTHVARAAGLPGPFLREVMQAIGRPNPTHGERVFTHEDIEFARLVHSLLDAGLPRAEMLEVARVLSQGIANGADAVRRVVGDALLRPGDSEFRLALRATQVADQLGPVIAPLLGYQFRAHLRDGIRGELVTEAERESGRLAGTRDVGVAFADLVDYTRLGERLPPEGLGRIAGRLSELATQAARRPVQLVKTIGDAAMFVSPSVDPLLDAMVGLADAIDAEGSEFPRVRVGIACGPATTRGGDWFGPTINVASRITDLAKPGRILTTDAVQAASPDRSWVRKRRRNLKGVDGRVRLYALDRGDEGRARVGALSPVLGRRGADDGSSG